MSTNTQPTTTTAQKASQAVLSIVRNPLYNIIIHALANLAISTVHNPASREALKLELAPLRDALNELYANDPPITQ